MAETRNIVILGASNGGLAAAHYLCRHVLPRLKQAKGAEYVIHLVDPSTHYWWHVSAPRAIVSVKEIKHSDYFKPIADGFKQYNLGGSVVIHQGTATGLSTESRTVQFTTSGGQEESLVYYALVIATGIRSPTPLTTLHGDHKVSQDALEAMNVKLSIAKEVIIGGGGPIGVETAGEIVSFTKAKVTIVTAGKKLIPVYTESRAQKVHNALVKKGIKIIYSTKVTDWSESDGKASVTLDNGQTLTADVYIPASGTQPNTSFLPPDLVTDRGYVKTNLSTLRVDAAGPRVYASGDVAGVNPGGMLHLFDTAPVVGANIAHDLLTDAKLAAPAERAYKTKSPETQLIPIGPKTGIGAFNGWGLPSFMVAMFKSKDYMKGQIAPITTGSKFSKA